MAIQYSDDIVEAMKKAQATTLDHARAIGELCMSWAALDAVIDEIIEPLIGCDEHTVSCITSSIDRFEPRMDIAKRLMILANLDKEWRDWICSIFNRINSEISPLRNRYVHDRWKLQRGTMNRIEKRAVTKKIQSRQPESIVFNSQYVTPVDKVDLLRKYIDSISYALDITAFDLRNWRKTGQIRQFRQQLLDVNKPRTRMDHFPIMIVWNGERLPTFSYITDP